MKRISTNICLIIIALLTSSCGSTAFTMQPVSTATDPTLSATMPLRATSTISPVPTTAPGIEATLDSTEARNTIATYLDTGGDCKNPCFLGIYPGKTTVSEMELILTHLGLPIWNHQYKGVDIYGINYESDNGLSLNGTFNVEDQLVNNLEIGIGLETSKIRDARNWLAFSPETMISRYRTPSEVTIALDWGPRSFFEMNIYFGSMELIVEYIGHDLLPSRNNSMTICPLVAQFESIRIWMGKDPMYPPPAAVSLEKATSLTMEGFAELMTGNPDQACFTMNRDAFP